MQTWKWGIATPQGIIEGEITGELEPGDTLESVMQKVADTATNFVQEQCSGILIVGCFVSNGELLSTTPYRTTNRVIDITKRF